MKNQSLLSLSERENLRKLIAQKTGLEIREQNLESFDKLMISRIKKLTLNSPEQYLNFLKNHTRQSQKEWEELVSQLTNNESYFFRDKGQFRLLEETILPELIKRKKFSKSLRICSAGCSTGPEPYSLAILLKELIPNIQDWNILILGVDINQDVLDVAKQGVYSSWSFRKVDEIIKEKYFSKIGEQYQINNEIKQFLKFEVCNLVEDQLSSKKSNFYEIDLIICRNVFIYFSQKTIEKILDNFYKKLQPSGYLLTGHAEISSQNLSIKRFKKKLFSQSLIYQKPQLNEVIKTKENSVTEKQLCSSVKQVKNKINTTVLDVIPKPPQPLSQFTIDLLTSLNQSKEMALTKTDNRTKIEEIKLLLEKKQYDLVIQELEIILEQFPHDLNSLYLLAETHANIGEYKTAINYCKAAIKIDHFSLKFYYLMNQIYEEEKEFEQAKKILNQIIYLDSNSVYGYFKLGDLYQDQGNIKKANKMYKNALKILYNLPHEQPIPELNNISVQGLIIKLSNLET